MPLYEIHHSCALSPSQRAALARAITTLHCTTFSAPSIFVNVTFHPTSGQTIFVGGALQCTNYILGHLRPRPNNAANRTHVVATLTQIWNEHARPLESALGSTAPGNGRLDDERALHNVFLIEDIVAGAEQGFMLPVAGQDAEWAKENMGEFERRAGEGDESMRVLVQEYKAKL
ncbi:hypothetical protein EJ07DRAFT_105836 [Lizonia empirigonia]|nr:hypothetical protein EJ07DRAFT_105836 [Lizonia empirigonia]